MNNMRRDLFLKIETIRDYSPFAPILYSRKYGRDCMFNMGHEYGRLTREEILGSTLEALVYRQYLDPDYTIPEKGKIIESDVNEPPWNRRVPGAVLYAVPGERLFIHVFNDDKDCHSFHLHGLKYGIDSDGAWPLGIQNHEGDRSDEILPGRSWTYVFDATPETIGPWAFHDHVRDVQQNVARGLFGGLIVRNPSTASVDYEIPLFVHQMSGVSKGTQFRSDDLSPGSVFRFKFDNPETVNYHCGIHGTEMAGRIEVKDGSPTTPSPIDISIRDNFFDPAMITIGPGVEVRWTNGGQSIHSVLSPGGGASNFCINGRTYVGNTPTIVGFSGEQLRWYLFNLDLGDIWHNFHPHSSRWRLPNPPDGATDVHSLSPVETFVVDTEIPPVLTMPCILEDLQCDPPLNACRILIKGDFLFHCHIETHMMEGLAGLLRARQYVWVTKDMVKQLKIELPYEDELNECPPVNVMRCKPRMSVPMSHEVANMGPSDQAISDADQHNDNKR